MKFPIFSSPFILVGANSMLANLLPPIRNVQIDDRKAIKTIVAALVPKFCSTCFPLFHAFFTVGTRSNSIWSIVSFHPCLNFQSQHKEDEDNKA